MYGSVRREADAQRLEAELGSGFRALRFDVRDEASIREAAEAVQADVGGQGLAGLVNNAGVAFAGPLLHLAPADFREQLEVNVVGVHVVTQAFLPLLGAASKCSHRPGRVVNVSSVSGRVALPFMGPYAASKHALEAYSDSLRRELLLYGVDVIVVQPTAIRTPMLDKIPDPSPYEGTDYEAAVLGAIENVRESRAWALAPSRVSGVVRVALTARRPRTRYPVLADRLQSWWLPRWLPDRVFDRIVGRRLGWIR